MRSGTVLRYVRDAPLAKFSDEHRALEARHQVARVLQDLQRQTSTPDERSTAQMTLLERISADLEKTRRASLVCPYGLKVSDQRRKLHRVQRGSSALPSRERSTTCGVSFGFSAFTSHPVLHELSTGRLVQPMFGGLPRLCRDLHRYRRHHVRRVPLLRRLPVPPARK